MQGFIQGDFAPNYDVIIAYNRAYNTITKYSITIDLMYYS